MLHVVTYSGKLQCFHVVLVGYVPTCPKLSEITNHQYLWRGLSGFVDFLHVVIYILLDIHWSYQKLLYWAGIVRHRPQPIRLSDVLNLKKLKTMWGFKLIVCLHWRYRKYHAISGYAAKYSWCISWRRIFYIWLVWLVNLNIGGSIVTLYILVYFIIFAYLCTVFLWCSYK